MVCEKRVVLIDFGKATMIECLVTYNNKKADKETFITYTTDISHMNCATKQIHVSKNIHVNLQQGSNKDIIQSRVNATHL